MKEISEEELARLVDEVGKQRTAAPAPNNYIEQIAKMSAENGAYKFYYLLQRDGYKIVKEAE